jgi:hypothetical protein
MSKFILAVALVAVASAETKSSRLVADGTCTDAADHTIWEATGKTNFTTDMRSWYVCV